MGEPRNGPGCPDSICADMDGLNGVNLVDLVLLGQNWQKNARQIAKKRKRRIIYDNDGNEIVYFLDEVYLNFTNTNLNGTVYIEYDPIIGFIQSSGKTLLGIINDVLDLSKIESGKMDFNYEPVDIKRLIEEIIGMFKEKCMEKNLQSKPKHFLYPSS